MIVVPTEGGSKLHAGSAGCRLTARICRLAAALVVISVAVTASSMAAAQDSASPSALEIVQQDNVEYGKGGDTPLRLDLCRPAGKGSYPGVICIHGGAWRAGSKSSLKSLTTRLAKEGFVAVTVQYRFAPQHPFPAQVEDVKCAVRWLRANAKQFGLDPDRIGAIGFSAGGHLSLMLGAMDAKDGLEGTGGHAEQSSKVQAVVNFFGPADLSKAYPEAVQGLLRDFVGGAIDEKREAIRQASPVTYLDANDAPILTFHGTQDPIVPYEQAKLLDEGCKQSKLKHELHTIDGAGHGWGGEQLLETIEQSIAFFKQTLAQPAPQP